MIAGSRGAPVPSVFKRMKAVHEGGEGVATLAACCFGHSGV